MYLISMIQLASEVKPLPLPLSLFAVAMAFVVVFGIIRSESRMEEERKALHRKPKPVAGADFGAKKPRVTIVINGKLIDIDNELEDWDLQDQLEELEDDDEQ